MFKHLLFTCSALLLGITFSYGQTTISVPVLSGTDDAEEVGSSGSGGSGRAPGDLDLSSSDLEITNDTDWNGDGQIVGLRFTDISIPQGAYISSAHLEFVAKSSTSDPASFEITTEAVDNASTFAETSENISSRPPSSSVVEWNEENGWTADETETSVDIAPVIQEVIDREGWSNGNALAVMITGSGVRRAYSYDNSPETAPKLVVTYMPKATISANILASTDDAEEVGAAGPDASGNATGDLDLGSSDLELVDDNGWNGAGQHVGMRFANLNIPQGATVTNAYLEFTSKYNDESEVTSIEFRAEDADHSSTFSNTPMNISSRPTTESAVAWNEIAQWTEAGGKYASPDLSSLIEEVIAREGWSTGNALSIIATGSGERTAQSYDNSPETAPKLIIEYLQEEIVYTPELVKEIPDQTVKTGWNIEIDARSYFRDLDSELMFEASADFGAALPAGLLLNNGVLSGSIAEPGAYPIHMKAKSDGDSISDMFMVFVEPQPMPLLEMLGTIKLGAFDEGAAEISAYDAGSQQLFVTNAEMNTIDIVDFSDPANLTKLASIDLPEGTGGVNSVAVHNGLLVAAYEATVKQDNGFVYAYDTDGAEQWNVTIGALPDMIAFNEDGTKVIVANEGEPSEDYSVDPEGSVSIIDVATQDVSTADFTAYNGQEATLAEQGIRIFGPNATVAQDLEPEYVTVKGDKAYVTLQENNAIAVIDIATATVESLIGLGYKDHSLPGNGLDVPDTDYISISNWPFQGIYMPDALATYEAGGTTYLVTVNEGDSRDYDGYSEESEIGQQVLDPSVFPNADAIQDYAGSLKITMANAEVNNEGQLQKIYTFGTRSFSIWNASTGELVYDSGDDLEQITASLFPDNFNASNSNFEFKNRSDDKGPEPEAITIGMVDGVPHAFIGLERVGGIMVYDISDPAAPEFVEYVNNRNFDAADIDSPEAGDSGPEGMVFIPAADSPNGTDMLVVSNEVSGTVTAYSIGQAQESFTLNIFHNNDGESKLLADTINYNGESIPAGSIGQFKQTLEDQRLEAENRGYTSILLSSGDNFLAGLEYNASQANDIYYDAVAIDSLNYDAIDLGNHDFDFGTGILAEFINAIEVNQAPFLSANLGFSNVPELQTLVDEERIKPSTIIERDGELIGVVGLTTPLLPTISSPGNTEVSEAIIDSVQKQVDMLTDAGINKIILISHLQGLDEDRDLAGELTGVDIMIAGGGDELLSNDPDLGNPYNIEAVDSYPIETTDKDGKPVYIVTTPGSYRFLGNLLVDFNDEGEVTRVYETNPILVKGASNQDLIEQIEEPILDYIGNLSTNVIAIAEDTLDFRRETLRGAESNGGNLFADALLYQAKKSHAGFGAKEPQVALQNSGGLRIESLIDEGEFTEELTYRIAAFTNIVSVVEDIAPAKFLSLMEHGVANAPALDGRFPQIAGFEILYDQGMEAGNRIVSITLDDGTEIVKDGEVVEGAPDITLATIDFTAGGGDGYPFEPLEYTTLGATYQQAFLNYLTAEDGLDSLITEAMYPFDAAPSRIKVQITEADAVEEINEDFSSCPDLPEGWVEYNSDADLIFCDGSAIGFNGYSVGAGTSWLITPKVTVDADDYVLSFDRSLQYGGPDPEVLYSSDYNGIGDPNEATWTILEEATDILASNTSGMMETGDIDLSSLDETVHFAIRYTSNGSASGESKLFSIDNVDIAPVEEVVNIGFKTVPELQGSGMETPFDNSKTETTGIVTQNFSGEAYPGAGFDAMMDGFFIQDVQGDDDAATSDGIFVYSDVAVETGDSVYITGIVQEMFGQTQVGEVESVDIVSGDHILPSPVEINLPLTSVEDFEMYEGMLVTFPQTLSVTENRNVDNFGEVRLSAEGILYKSTNLIDPNDADPEGLSTDGTSNVEAVLAHTAENKAKSILLEDNRSGSGNMPLPFISEEGNIRAGSSTTASLEGILSYGFNEYRLHPTAAVSFDYNEREAVPELSDATLKVASFNVLNYFNGDGMGDFSGNNRGTTDAGLFAKQSEKIVAALVEMDADVIGLMEIENDEAGEFSSMKTLTDSLNAALGVETYAYVETGRVERADGTADEIKNGFMYKMATVDTVGDYAILNNDYDPNYKDERSRPAVAQTFRSTETQGMFTAVVNHFKSKGSGCGDEDPNMNDDQGNCNGTRTMSAETLADWLTTDPTNSGDSDFLIMGDLNAYAQEDPIDALRLEGYTTLTADSNFTYVYDGEHGSLDHALANDNLLTQVTATKVWHINSVEPDFLAYNGVETYYEPTPFRSSDHDPVMIGLNLTEDVVGLSERVEHMLYVYPNPSEGAVHFNKEVSATIYNQLGVLVTSIENETTVHLEEKGLYIVKFSTGETAKVFIK